MMDIDTLIKRATEFSYKTGTPLRPVPVKVKQGLGAAAYHAITDTVRLDPPAEQDTEAVIFCDLCHEFCHAQQRKKYGLLGYLLAKTFLRPLLQHTPTQVGLQACQWYCNEYNH